MGNFGQDFTAAFEKARQTLRVRTVAPRLMFHISSRGLPLLKTLRELNAFSASLMAAQKTLELEESPAALLFATELGKHAPEIKTWDDLVKAMKSISANSPELAASFGFGDEGSQKSAARIQDAINDVVRTGTAIDPRSMQIFEKVTGKQGLQNTVLSFMGRALANISVTSLISSVIPDLPPGFKL